MNNQTQTIQAYILKHIAKHPADIATKICERFSVTRMTATRQLQKLILMQKIVKSGKTSDTRYYLASDQQKSIRLKISPSLDEFAVYTKYLEPGLMLLPKNQREIFEYSCTELINNAKDHSQGEQLQLKTMARNGGFVIHIRDNGIGIFKKLQKAFNAKDLQEGLLALSKGKVTTDPVNHTGEGVFFSSRAVDRFTLEANGLRYIKDNAENDWTYEQIPNQKGTAITLFVDRQCTRTLKTLFLSYMDSEELNFDKTEILIELSKLGHERYISRSQAKRILTGLEKFKRIVLDFRGIETVGQGFVDDVFRVFQEKYPHIQITYCNANENVTFMIKRGLTKKNGS